MYKKTFLFFIPYLIVSPLFFLYFYYVGDSILLGGEGNYFLDFSNYNENFISMWSHWGLGHNQYFLNAANTLTFFLSLIDNPRINSFIIYFLLYILPFILFFNFTALVSNYYFTRIIASVFYCFNPFTISFLNQMNIWNNSIVFLIPIYLFIIFKFFDDYFLLIPILSISFFLLNLIGNPPIFVVLILIVNIFIIYKSIETKTSLYKTLIILLIINCAYILTNLHIVMSFLFGDSNVGSIYEAKTVKNWLFGTSYDLKYYLEILIGIHHFGDPNFDSFSRYFNHILVKIILISYTVYIFYSAYKLRDQIIIKYLISLYILFFFLSKGVLAPGGFIYSLMFEFIPMFNIFKTPTEKFAVIIFTLLSVLILKVFSSNFYNNSMIIKNSILIILLFPIYSGFIFLDHNSVKIKSSKIYPDFKEDIEVINFIEDNYSNSIVLHLPGHMNYQSWKININNKKTFSGNDPILHNLKNNRYMDFSLNNDIYNSIIANDYEYFFYLSSLYNVRLLYFNKNHLYPFSSVLNYSHLDQLFQHENIKLVYEDNGIHIYEIINTDNKHILRSIKNYSKIHVTRF